MLSIETEIRLADCFLRSSQSEREVEQLRLLLCSLPSFSPLPLFQRIDRSSSGFLTCADLQDQMYLSGNHCSGQESFLMLRQYDGDKDGRLNFKEFLNWVLPATQIRVREDVMRREVYPLSYEVEQGFFKLLLAELQYHQSLESARSALVSRYDFNLLDAFRTIDVSDSSGLGTGNIRAFMLRRGVQMSEEEAGRVIRRVDCDDDQRISYTDFVDFVLPTNSENAPDFPQTPKRKPGTPSRRASSSLKKSNQGSSVSLSSSKKRSPLRQNPARFSTPLKSPQNSFVFFPEEREYTLSRKFERSQDFPERVLSDLSLFQDLERAKIELIQSRDFHPITVFRLFDIRDRNEVSEADFSTMLKNLGVSALDEDLERLILRGSSSNSHKLSYSDLNAMLSPVEKGSLERSGGHPLVYPFLTQDTLQRLRRVCELLLASEHIVEGRKDVFDTYEDAELAVEEVLKKQRISATSAERHWLLERYLSQSLHVSELL